MPEAIRSREATQVGDSVWARYDAIKVRRRFRARRSAAMLRRVIAFLACWIILPCLSPGIAAEQVGTKADQPDAERIKGVWVLEEYDRPNDLFTDKSHTVQIKFEDQNFEFKVLKDGGAILQIGGTYYVDDQQTPKLLDITLSGDGGSTPLYAIYDFKGDKLRVRIRDNNGPRPVDFEPASDCQTFTYRRAEESQ